MATGVLRAFGLTEEQLRKAREAWLAIPNAITLHGQHGVTMGQFERLKAVADRQKCSVEALLNAAFEEAVGTLLKSATPRPPNADKERDASKGSSTR